MRVNGTKPGDASEIDETDGEGAIVLHGPLGRLAVAIPGAIRIQQVLQRLAGQRFQLMDLDRDGGALVRLIFESQ